MIQEAIPTITPAPRTALLVARLGLRAFSPKAGGELGQMPGAINEPEYEGDENYLTAG
jgi:hypothetical protein